MRLRLVLALLCVLLVPAGAQGRGARMAPLHRDTPQTIPVHLAKQVRDGRMAGMKAFTVSASQQFLPTTWCGSERTTDDTADAAQLSGDAVIKVVYAYASDQPDRFSTWKNALQANVSLIGQFMAQQDGATKTPRFDMGTSCGPQYLDIQTVALPLPRSAYLDDFAAIDAAVGAAIGATPVTRDVITLADGLTTNTGGLYGLGQHYIGDIAEVAGASNIHNGGDLYAALFPPLNHTPGSSFWPEGMLHEITHMLGAVNSGAPHATSAGHCTDGYDVMCYADGGTSSVPYSTGACPSIGGVTGMTQTYDCGRDDYFSTSPAPGSYLATHWNVYDSAFEATCATSGFACGSDSTLPPSPVAAPQVTGTRRVGNLLTADHGTWTGSPTSYTYQWQRIAGANPPADIPGATSASYALVAADATTQVQVVVTATNPNGSGTSTSDRSAISASSPPVENAPPSISGTARRLSVLSASGGAWTGAAGRAFTWQRLAGATWTDIPGQAGSSYTLTSADVGTSVRVLETATNADGSVTAASNAIGPVAALLPSPLSGPVVTGAPQRTRSLSASTGSWAGAPAIFAYRWQRDSGAGFADIPAAIASSHLLDAADVGARLRVVVTATNVDGASVPVASDAVGPVQELPGTSAPLDVFRSAMVALRHGRRTALRLRVTSRVSARGVLATVPRASVRVARRGWYRLTLCAGPTCVTKPFRARHGRARLPQIVADSITLGPVKLRLIGPGGQATGSL